MDIQKLFDAMADQGRIDRSKYHLTLGRLIDALKDVPPDAKVEFDSGYGVGEEHSYRGYYSDLSFDSTAVSTASEALMRASNALGGSYEGYKGGDFTMGADTPLWSAPYGCCGRAIIGVEMRGDVLTLVTKDLDA